MSDASYPDDRRYHEEHDWAKPTDDPSVAEFGVTWFAQDALGDVVYFEPPEVGFRFEAGGSYGELESVKAVSDLVAPLGGEVVEVNQRAVDGPDAVNSDPYDTWLVRVKLDDPAGLDTLLTADQYSAALA